MKNRMVSDAFWVDDYTTTLPRHEILFFLYLLTNDKVNLIGIYQLPDAYMMLATKMTKAELDAAKRKFQKDGKVIFINGWVRIVNFSKYNKFNSAPLQKAIDEQIKLAPSEIKEYAIDSLSIGYREPIDSSSNSNSSSYSNSLSNSKPEKTKIDYDINWLKAINDEQVEDIAKVKEVEIAEVRRYVQSAIDWYEEKPTDKSRKGRNWRATVMSWLQRDLDSGKILKKQIERFDPRDLEYVPKKSRLKELLNGPSQAPTD